MRNNLEERFEQARNLNQSGDPAPIITNLPPMSTGNNQQVGSVLNFVTPTELVDLPSKGLLYPEGHPLHGKDTVEIRQMTAKEEDILTNKTLVKKGLIIDRLIESILVDKTIKVDSLLVGDKNAIMVAARISAYGPTYDLVISCTECGSKNMQQVDLTSIETRDAATIDQQISSNEILHTRLDNGAIVVKLPKTGWYVECRLLNGGDEQRLLKFLENKRKTDAEAEITLMEQLMFIISSINTIYDTQTVLDAIKMMPAGDAKFLRSTYNKLIPSVQIVCKYTCSSCNSEQKTEVPFTQEFFWPK